jgi:hypothetical protein
MLRIPHCLDNRLTDGGKVVSPTYRPHFTPQKHYYFSVSGTHFCFCGVHPVALNYYNFYKLDVNRNWNVIYLLQSHSPQHLSAPTGHLQVDHTSVILIWCYQYYNGSVVFVILSLFMQAVRTMIYLFTVFLIMLKLQLELRLKLTWNSKVSTSCYTKCCLIKMYKILKYENVLKMLKCVFMYVIYCIFSLPFFFFVGGAETCCGE